jgi:pyruvate dehydrogenase E2 component (dihydrolipoamide acetyltransferase)
MAEFVMPTLGADMEAGTLAAWLKRPGDMVKRGEIIAEVDTDKGLIEVEVFTSGVIEQLLVQPGEQVPVGTVLAIIREEGQPAPGDAAPEKPSAPPVAPPPPPPSLTAAPTAAAESARLKISPAAKKMAAALGIDPAAVRGTGPGGRITREDIEQAAAKTAAPSAAQSVRPPETAPDRATRMRQTIAAAMARSKREIPHYYLSATIDMSQALNWLAEENRRRPVADRLLYGVLLIKAVALALREVPELNAVWADGQVRLSEAIHVGVAISLRQGGLVAPALRDADRQSLGELMKNFRDLVTRARTERLRSTELSDATITLTSLGEQGVESVFGIIYPPQVALVGFGKVVERPWVVDGQIIARPVITATLSADHRASDGHRGGLFLAAVERLLQTPEKL